MKTVYAKIHYYFRQFCVNTVCQLGFRRQLLRERQGQCILLYHGIDTEGRTDLNGRYLGVNRFEEQIRYIKEHFNVVSLSDIFEGRIDANRFNVAITFDDGYQNNLDVALPVLERYKVPATFFLTAITATDYPMLWADYLDMASYLSSQPISINGVKYFKKKGQYFNAKGQSLKMICKQQNWSFKQLIYTAFPEANSFLSNESLKIYWQQLDPDAIRSLDASPWATIGIHAYIHDNLGNLPPEQATDNLRKAKGYLENIVQHSIQALAYADGSYSRELLDAAEKIGFKEQYAVDYLFPKDQEDQRILNRFTINPYTSIDHQIYAILTGKY